MSKEKLLSIRLSPDGLSFWTTGLVGDPEGGFHAGYLPDYKSQSKEKYMAFSRELGPAESVRRAMLRAAEAAAVDKGPVCLMIDTCKTVLIPEELFDESQITDYLRINNIAVGQAETVETVRVSLAYSWPVALVIYNRAVLDAAREVFGDRLFVTSPFETASVYIKHGFKRKDAGGNFTSLYLTGSNAYITVRNIGTESLEYCEVLPYSSPADILYYMQEVGARFGLHKNPMYIRGVGVKDAARMLKKSFKKCKCE